QQLMKVLGSVEVLEMMGSEVSQAETGWQLALDQDARLVGEDHLSAMRGVRDPGRSVDVEADIRPAVDGPLACVKADANLDRHVIGPFRRSQRTLGRSCRGDR